MELMMTIHRLYEPTDATSDELVELLCQLLVDTSGTFPESVPTAELAPAEIHLLS
jgi:hypothetical protein